MKKLLFAFLLLLSAAGARAEGIQGRFLSQSGELMFEFKGDSLYIDIAQSRRNVSAFKLVKNREGEGTITYNAFETYLSGGQVTYREVLIRVTREDDGAYLLEYFGKDKDRDYNSNERYTIRREE